MASDQRHGQPLMGGHRLRERLPQRGVLIAFELRGLLGLVFVLRLGIRAQFI